LRKDVSLTTITDIDFASEVGGSENLFRVARLILARLWGRGRFTVVPYPLYMVSLNHRQTKRRNRPGCIRQFYAQRFLRDSTRKRYS